MARYVVLGTSVYGIENQGDEALLSTLVRELKRNDPEAFVTWVARHPDQDLAESYGLDEVVCGLEHETKAASTGRWFNGLNAGDDTGHLRRLSKLIEQADLLIVGGDPFQEISLGMYRGLAPHAALLVTLAKFLGTKVVLYSIHIGARVLSEHARELTRFCIENAALTTLREQFSMDRLIDYGIGTQTCRVLADSAWGLDPVSDPESREKILQHNKIRLPPRPVVGLNIRHNYWQWSPESWARKRKALCGLVDHIVESLDADVLSIPNCTYDLDHRYEDDREVAREMKEEVAQPDRLHLIEHKMSLHQTLSLFAGLQYHVSNRRHSAIFAAVHSIPVLALGGMWHVRPGMDEVGMGMPLLEPEFWTSKNLVESFDHVVNNRESILASAAESLPRLRELANTQAVLMVELATGV